MRAQLKINIRKDKSLKNLGAPVGLSAQTGPGTLN